MYRNMLEYRDIEALSNWQTEIEHLGLEPNPNPAPNDQKKSHKINAANRYNPNRMLRIHRTMAKSCLNRADRSPISARGNPNLATLRNQRYGGKSVPIERSRRGTSGSGVGSGSRGRVLQGSGSDRVFVC
jgi:hypothetical protein